MLKNRHLNETEVWWHLLQVLGNGRNGTTSVREEWVHWIGVGRPSSQVKSELENMRFAVGLGVWKNKDDHYMTNYDEILNHCKVIG